MSQVKDTKNDGIMHRLFATFRPKASRKADALSTIEDDCKEARLELAKAIADLSVARSKRQESNGY